MNFGNDFSDNLTGWQGVVGTAPGALALATDVVNLAPPVVKSKVTSGFVVTPAGVSGKNGTTATIFLADLLLQGTALYVVARFSPTAYIGVKIESTRLCSVVEYHTGAEHLLASVDLTPMLPPATEAPLEVRLSFYGTNVLAVVNSTPVIEVACTVITDGLAGFGFVGVPLGTEIADRCAGALDILDNSGTTRVDCEYDVLAAAGYPGTISDKEKAWLIANGGTGNTLLDCWKTFLDSQSIPAGDTMDRRHNWLLGLLGVSDAIGDSWLDLWKAFWCEFGGDIGGAGGVALSKDPFFTTPIYSVWTPIVPAHAVYTNDFSGTGGNDLTGWTSGYSGAITTQATVSGGTLNVATRQAELYAPGEYTDCDVSASVLKSCLGSAATFGLRARLNSTGDNLGFYLNGTTGAVSVYDFIGGIWTELGGQSAQQPIPGPLVAVRLKVIGNTFEVYIDGVLTNSGTTSVSGAGKTGIRAGEIGATLEDYSSTSLDSFYFYDTADFTVYVSDVGLSQTGAKTLPTGTAGTFHIRLREAHATDTIVTIRNGTTLLGNVTITAGQVYRQVRYILSAPVSKDFSFTIISPVTGMLYTNDFSGTGGNDLTGWYAGLSSGSMAPVTTEVALVGGNVVPKLTNLMFVADVSSVDFDVSAGLIVAANEPRFGLALRLSATAVIWVYGWGGAGTREIIVEEAASGGGVPYRQPCSFQGSSGVMNLRVVGQGSKLTIYVNGVYEGECTTIVTGAGKHGFRGGALDIPVATDFRASSGGVAFESFAAGVTAADGGIPQTLDPYFNDPTKWSNNYGASSDYIANNVLTFPGTGAAYLAMKQVVPGTVSGDVVEVRVYCDTVAPGDMIDIKAGELISYHRITQGWNAAQVTLNATTDVALMRNGSADLGASKFHFFFAWKATPVKLYVP